MTINFNNLQSGWEGNFKIIPEQYWDSLGTRYETGSVMHYGSYAASINGKRVITDKKTGGNVQVQRQRATSLDILEVCIFYNCACSKPNAGNVRFCNSDTNFNVMKDE